MGNLIVSDILIREYVINFISLFNTKVAQVFIYREKSKVIIRIFSYNDSFTNWNSFILKHKKELDYISLNNYLKVNKCIGYSGKRLLSLNLSYLLKTNVIIKNTNIISHNQRIVLLRIFNYMGLRLKSPLSKYLRTKFICLVYYSLLYKSALLLCRYLRFIVPRFCKKKRKSRKINPFLKSLKSVIGLMFTGNFIKHACVKGVKILFKGRINGSRRKRTHIIKCGQTSTQSFKNQISYYQEDCLTIFGILGIKVWIIY